TAQSYAADNFGWHHPWWAYALGFWAVIVVLGLAQVRLSSLLLGVLSLCEILVILTLCARGLTHPAAGRLTFTALSPSSLKLGPTVGALLAIAVLAFVG